VAQVRGGDNFEIEEIITIDRKTKQPLVRISNNEVNMYSKKMQKMSQFCMETFPYVLLRDFKSLYMLDISNNRQVVIQDNVEACNDWVFFVNNEFDSIENTLNVMVTQVGPKEKKILNYEIDEDFVEALKTSGAE
jgi:hypothetical protein